MLELRIKMLHLLVILILM